MPIRSVVFDLDGTLVDSAPDIIDTLRAAAAAAGINCDVPITAALIGPPIVQMFRNWQPDLSEMQVEQANAAFRRLYDSSPLPKTLPYPGIPRCVEDLRSKDYSIYVATNKPHSVSRKILDRHFPQTIDGLCCVDSLPERKIDKTEMLRELTRRFDLDALETIIVGDGESDLNAGKALGWRTMAVLYGYCSANALRSALPTWIVTSPSEITPIVTSAAGDSRGL